VAGSQRYLVLFVAVAILSSLAIVGIALSPLGRDPLTIPPGETRGMISVCFSYSGASIGTFWVTMDGVERGNVTIPRRTTQCVYPLLDPGTHIVIAHCTGSGASRTWSVDLSSRQVVQLSFGCS
jgi:hypothetical protein